MVGDFAAVVIAYPKGLKAYEVSKRSSNILEFWFLLQLRPYVMADMYLIRGLYARFDELVIESMILVMPVTIETGGNSLDNGAFTSLVVEIYNTTPPHVDRMRRVVIGAIKRSLKKYRKLYVFDWLQELFQDVSEYAVDILRSQSEELAEVKD
jgi:hypothetical protein